MGIDSLRIKKYEFLPNKEKKDMGDKVLRVLSGKILSIDEICELLKIPVVPFHETRPREYGILLDVLTMLRAEIVDREGRISHAPLVRIATPSHSSGGVDWKYYLAADEEKLVREKKLGAVYLSQRMLVIAEDEGVSPYGDLLGYRPRRNMRE